jgi:hypothetical protein
MEKRRPTLLDAYPECAACYLQAAAADNAQAALPTQEVAEYKGEVFCQSVNALEGRYSTGYKIHYVTLVSNCTSQGPGKVGLCPHHS